MNTALSSRAVIRKENVMKEKRMVHYVKGVFVCPQCRQSYVQEKWIEEWRVRCHKCDYRGSLTHVSVAEQTAEEIRRHCAANTQQRPLCLYKGSAPSFSLRLFFT